MSEGIMVRWDADHGYGWVRLEDGEKLFVHELELESPEEVRTIEVGKHVSFKIYRNEEGAVATKVRVVH